LKVYLIIASINELLNMAQFRNQLTETDHEIKVVIIDEGEEKLRGKNKHLLRDINYEFYGPKERTLWFKQRFNKKYKTYLSVIPRRCHAETSFGFLIAYEEGAEVVIELDDDVFPVNGNDLVQSHLHNIFDNDGVKVNSKCKWYNTIENLVLNSHYPRVFPRGHPYSPEVRLEDYTWKNGDVKCVLNMGLWISHPDLDALTVLHYGGLDGKCNIHSENLKREKVVIEKGTYFAICSMNTAFVSKIIPAFYQLYMNHMGIDRFDDVWSGIFLKKIADHLGDNVSLGKPLVYHNKRPRNVFKDLRNELEGMAINEMLWRIVDGIELAGRDYYECYSELANKLEKHSDRFTGKLHTDFIRLQTEKMKLWLEIIDKLE